MKYNKQTFEINNINLGEAMNIASDYKNATEEQLASARTALRGIYEKISIAFDLVRTELEDRAKQKMVQDTIFSWISEDGTGTEVLTETITVTSVDLAGIHKDAQPVVSASYSDLVYAEMFRPTAVGSKKEAIRLANEGRLPNASKRVKTTTIVQTKLFDIVAKSENKEDK
jgi:hypothetical protein